MKTTFKILLTILTTLVALCLVAVLAITTVVDPNEYKGEIVQLVREKTGRELMFDGDIELSFLPYLGFSVGPVSLGNGLGFSDSEMVRLKRAEISLQLKPLFSGGLAVGTIVLDGLSVHLIKNAQGVTNWDDLFGKQDAGSAAKGSESEKNSTLEGKGMALDSLSVEGVEITSATLVYTDMVEQSEVSVDALNLTLGAIRGTEIFPFELDFALSLDQPGIELRPRLSGDDQVTPASMTVALNNLQMSVLDTRITGNIQASSYGGSPIYSADLMVAETSLRHVMDKLGVTPPEMSAPAAMERFSAAMRIAGTSDSVELKRLSAKLDDSTITGRGSFSSSADPRITVAAQVDAVDVDRYLPPRAQPDETSEHTKTKAETTEQTAGQETDARALHDLELDASLEIGGLKVRNVKASDVKINADTHDGVLTVSPFELDLYGGRLAGRAVLDANGKATAWTSEAEGRDVNVGALLHDLLEKDVVSGVAAVEYALAGSGLTVGEVKKTLCGTATLSVSDGSVIGVDVGKIIRDGCNKAMGVEPDGEAAGNFDFTSVAGSATFRNGYAVNKDFHLDSSLVQADGAGWADLPGNTTDYNAEVTVVGEIEGLEGEVVEIVRGVPLPLRVNGALDDPAIGLDDEAMAELVVAAGVGVGLEVLADGLLGDMEDDSSWDEDDASESDDYSDDDDDDFLGDLF